jgi:acyl-CoA reductase-like NAD-dependent aldehyde dehydrogenase
MSKLRLQSKSLTPSLKHGRKLTYDRAKVLHKVAELMRQRKDEFAELITRMGKLVAQAEWEVNLVLIY